MTSEMCFENNNKRKQFYIVLYVHVWMFPGQAQTSLAVQVVLNQMVVFAWRHKQPGAILYRNGPEWT